MKRTWLVLLLVTIQQASLLLSVSVAKMQVPASASTALCQA